MPIRIALGLFLLSLSLARAQQGGDGSLLQAWLSLHQRVEALPREQRQGRRLALAREFLKGWEASGKRARGDDHHFLGLFLSAAGRTAEAQAARRACALDPQSTPAYRSASVAEFTRVVLRKVWDRRLDASQLAGAVRDLETLLDTIAAPVCRDERTMVVQALAQIHDVQHDRTRARARWHEAAALSPSLADDAADSAQRFLMEEALAGADAETVRKAMSAEVEALVALLVAWERGGTGRAEKAKRWRESIRARATSFELLGRPAPEWIVEHAYGGGRGPRDYRGRVVLVDCWATWCVWCIRSFPALRRLHAEFADQALAIVGVTAPAGRVWTSRFSCDPDLAGQAGARDPDPLVLPSDATTDELQRYRAREREAIGSFIRLHRLPWDVVLVAQGEPRAKLGLSGWPHLVLIDRQGRVRGVHTGALGFDPRSDTALRKMIVRLLAEKKER